MSRHSSETVVYECKLHWGIFLWPLFFTLSLMLPGVMALILSRVMLGALPPMPVPIEQPLTPFFSFWSVLMFTPALFFGGVAFAITTSAYLKAEVILTSDRLKFRTGWLSLGSSEILLTKIETITLWEPLIGRLAGYGTVSVTGTGGTVFPLRFLPQAEHLHSFLQSAVNAPQINRVQKMSLSEMTKTLAEMQSRYMPKE